MQLDTSESGILLNQHTSTQASGFFVCRKFRKRNSHPFDFFPLWQNQIFFNAARRINRAVFVNRHAFKFGAEWALRKSRDAF